MRYTLAVACIAAGLGVGGGLLIGWRTADRQPAPELVEKQAPTEPAIPLPKKDTQPVAKTEKTGVKIPFDKIYTTTKQRGMRLLDVRYHEDSQQELNELTKRLGEYRVLSTFIVSSATIRGALSESLAVFTKGQETWGVSRKRSEYVDGDPTEFEDALWVFLYLGTATEYGRPEMEVNEVYQRDSELVIAYRHTPSPSVGIASATTPYCFWVPLEKQTPVGLFTIRIIDSGKLSVYGWEKLAPEQKAEYGLGKEPLIVRVYISK
jgi:hypothetical protein